MEMKTIADIYRINAAIREKTLRTLAGISEPQAKALPEGEKWNIAEIVEHVSMVDEGMTRICAKLLAKAEAAAQLSNGEVNISASFTEKTTEAFNMKLTAPEFVQPTGEVSIKESISKLNENDAVLSGLRVKFETFDSTAHTFPHPYFGDLSAQEWLALRGGHEARHRRQIIKLLDRIEKENGPG
jgi:uncharacterized damage-inducible protein DinB